MKINRYLIPLLVPLLILIFSGCYSETVTSDGSVTLIISSKGDVGDSGAGYYFRAEFYDENVMDGLLYNGTITTDDANGGSIYYDSSLLPSPLVRYTNFIGGTNDPVPSEGSFTVSSLAPKRYRLLLEQCRYSETGEAEPLVIERAGISDAFIVNSGETTPVSVALLTASVQ
ncbi:hypothetical protein [Sediminispirochaeta bajacaliforniensis]|uniref:hypothetical protein n=1 Tax=Sediminispirochaeta bajacaliforniensis TaxID=148 RepID=UPI00036AD45C|nr:hypothetical protein [Sediminispirochaeta bajacaliforniensis]